MISKSTIKLINSLALKKYRTKEKLFLVEGDKLVEEVIYSDLTIHELVITPEFPTAITEDFKNVNKVNRVSRRELKQASLLRSPQNSLAICCIPPPASFPSALNNKLSVYLDGIQDPGNMGTIIRICDWYGIEYIFSSPDSVDLFNPKVIQASMGSFNRIKYYECSFDEVKNLAHKSGSPVYGTFMDGQNIYTQKLPESALLVMGNEGNGIRAKIENRIDKRISIPNFSSNTAKAESLNVSVATAIICSEFRRSVYSK